MIKNIQTIFAVAAVGIALAIGTTDAAESELNSPVEALVLKLDRQQWQALASVCVTPAFYNSKGSVPLIFEDGTENREVAIPHAVASVKDFGANASEATAALAKKYWNKAETVFVVENYEQSLWIVPSAALLAAPILVNPTRATLYALGTKEAVVVGEIKMTGMKVIHLETKKAVWRYQLALQEALGKKCDYVVMTNPYDTEDQLNPNVQWPYLSLAAAPLAAYRRAIVQTGNYTGDRKNLHNLGVSLGGASDKEKYEAIRVGSNKIVKDASYAVEKFVVHQGHPLRFLGMVGGSIELPYYICDLHTKYTYWNLSIDYVPAETPYATLRDDVDYSRFIKPNFAVGRIIADNIQDATVLLARTFFRKEYLPGGKYASLAPAGWEKKSIVLDGHRLNQPDEGGPAASPNEPFFPADAVQAMFSKSNLNSEYVFPRDETKNDSPGIAASELFSKTSNGYGFVQYVAHGDPPYMRIEAGRTGKDIKNYLATGLEFRKQLNFLAPTVAYVIGCNVGLMNAPFKNNEEFLPTAAIHAGIIAFMAPDKCQSICFWRFAPKGPGASQCINFWENALQKGMPIGEALIDAKWRGYVEWKDKQFAADRGKDSDNALEIDAPSMILYGDPALQLTE